MTGFPNPGDYYCGATIISSRYGRLGFEYLKSDLSFLLSLSYSPRYLITAAHCFETSHAKWNWDNIRVNVGAHNLKTKDYRSLKPKSYKI